MYIEQQHFICEGTHHQYYSIVIAYVHLHNIAAAVWKRNHMYLCGVVEEVASQGTICVGVCTERLL